MRILIFFLVLTNVSFAQLPTSKKLYYPAPIDSLIVGEWELKETITSAMYESDTMPKIRVKETNGSHIKITKDSLVIPHNERYYKRYEGYNYQLKGTELELYFGLKKNRKKVDSLTIELLDFQEMVLSSDEYISSPLGFEIVKVAYIYQRANTDFVDSIRQKLEGSWRTASNEPIDFRSDTFAKFPLFKDKEMPDSLQNHLKLEFFPKNVGIGMTYSYSVWSNYQTYSDGFFLSDTTVFIDYQRQLLYFPGKETFVYQYTFIGSNELILKYVKTIESE
jgi:hypothetical protein